MDDWKDIESAPRDGTKIDIWQDGKRYADVFWSYSTSDGKPILDPVWDGWAWDGSVGQSYTPNYVPDKGERATHWMPLPQPPATPTASQEKT